MKGKIGIPKAVLPVLALGLIGLSLGLGSGSVRAESRYLPPDVRSEPQEEKDAAEIDSAREFPVPVAPLPKTITPCRACHGPEKDFPVNFKRREALLVHKNVKLHHGGVRVWCLDCHNADDRNFLLSLSDGKPIKFEQSYLLCGKCHGTKFRDWRNGIHGKRTGYWNGEKTYYLCVSCHNPHTPKYKPIEPMPPPDKPWTPKEARAKK